MLSIIWVIPWKCQLRRELTVPGDNPREQTQLGTYYYVQGQTSETASYYRYSSGDQYSSAQVCCLVLVTCNEQQEPPIKASVLKMHKPYDPPYRWGRVPGKNKLLIHRRSEGDRQNYCGVALHTVATWNRYNGAR